MKNKIIIYISIPLIIIILFYFTSVMYNRHLININGQTFTIENKKISLDNYKSIEYERIIIPSCGVDMSIEFEKLHFKNDSVLVINKSSIPFDNLFIFRRMFNIGKSEMPTEEFHQKNDTLFLNAIQNIGGYKIIKYFTFKFENDSLHVGKYAEKRF